MDSKKNIRLFWRHTLTAVMMLWGAHIAAEQPWYESGEWHGLEADQLKPVIFNLSQSKDAKEQILAVILSSILQGEQAIAESTLDHWRESALEQAMPEDELILPLLAAFIVDNSNSAKAVREQALLRWQQREPLNLAPLLYQQTLAADELLQQAQSREHFELHFYPLRRWMYQALLKQLPDEQNGIAVELMGIVAASQLPNIKILKEGCRNNPPASSSIAGKQCRYIGSLLRQQSASLVFSALGIAILKEQSRDSNEQTMLDNERTQIRALLKQSAQVFHPQHFLQTLQDDRINGEREEIDRLLAQKSLHSSQ